MGCERDRSNLGSPCRPSSVMPGTMGACVGTHTLLSGPADRHQAIWLLRHYSCTSHTRVGAPSYSATIGGPEVHMQPASASYDTGLHVQMSRRNSADATACVTSHRAGGHPRTAPLPPPACMPVHEIQAPQRTGRPQPLRQLWRACAVSPSPAHACCLPKKKRGCGQKSSTTEPGPWR